MLRFAVLILSASLMSGCAVATAGMKKGDERSFVRSLNDVNAGRAVQARLKRAYDYELGGVDVEVSEGVVLLSGNVPRQEDRIEAARIAWSAPEIRQVGNEILIRDQQGFVRNAKDGVLEKSVRARLLADKYVKGRNYNVETHEGIVYLLGVARDERELDRAARIAALTRGTREVISYVRVAEASGVVVDDPSYPALPDTITREPFPQEDRSDRPAPMRQAQPDEPIPYSYPQPYDTGRSNVPATPNAAPYYIDPETGQQIRVRNRPE
ncbi:BON domain-containing protein [uncultured Algimonas sp.]|uniref:BON domain-containing protein n=1 Tax=uncultured Algimonas sp. TaxID=1547920 RepID=UPI0026248165|nr:BON domain-containing protein [uncultured Algimonas sp.]